MIDVTTPRLVAVLVLALILVGVAGAQDAPKVDDLLAAVERGDADAQWQLGDAYHHGRGVTQDDAEALRLYRAAAEQGSPAGQWRLGNAYFYGWGVTQDDAEAVRWYRAAAEQGHPPAQAALSEMYTYGAGVEEDPVLASMWIELAWRASLDGGDWRLYARQRAELASWVTAEQTAEGRRLARDWTPAPER
jgi:TPR repeat protein